MALVIADEDKIPKEALLLGKLEVEVTDCEGNQVTVHGLTANDLTIYETPTDMIGVPLAVYIQNQATGGGNISNLSVTLGDGSTTTLQQMADNISFIQDSI